MSKVNERVVRRLLRNIKRSHFFLFSFVVFGTLGQYSFAPQRDERSPDSVSASSVLKSHYLHDTVQEKYLSSDDDSTDGSVSTRLSDQFSVKIPGHTALPILNLNFEIYHYSINSFHYILTCGLSPPRSPPVFS